jgi:hypothetical protein
MATWDSGTWPCSHVSCGRGGTRIFGVRGQIFFFNGETALHKYKSIEIYKNLSIFVFVHIGIK